MKWVLLISVLALAVLAGACATNDDAGQALAAVTKCVDSDANLGEDRYFTQGTVTIGTAVSTDFCAPDGVNVKEYYCKQVAADSIDSADKQVIPTARAVKKVKYIAATETYECPFGCLNGACIAQNETNQTNTTVYCGDGVVNQAVEECDGSDLAGETCVSLGDMGGALLCTSNCVLDTSYCYPSNETNQTNTTVFCGDGVVNQAVEECDGTDLDGATCVTEGYDMGVLGCTSNCALDVSACSYDNTGNETNSTEYCGDGICNNGETMITCPLDCGYPGNETNGTNST